MNIDIKDAQNVYNNLIDNTFNKQENKSSGIKQIDINTVPDRSLHQLPYETAEKLFNLSLNQRLQYFEEIKEKMSDDLYWTVLRALWIDDGICSEQWKKLMYADRKRQHKIMKSSDRQALRKLPKVMPVYRACYEKEDEKNFNWTLDPNIAVRFHKKHIAIRKIKKSDIYAYFNSRNEKEIILKPELLEGNIHKIIGGKDGSEN